MKHLIPTLFLSLSAVSAIAQTDNDSISSEWERQLSLNEVVIIGHRPVVKLNEGKIIYLVKNDPYAKGLEADALLGRIPRVSVNNGSVSVAGKGNVRYIIDGVLMELSPEAMTTRLRNMRADDIEKIELLTTPPARYAVEANAAYISITTKDETLGTRGNIYGSLNQGDHLRGYFSGSLHHTTRRVEFSIDASTNDYRGINDNDMTYLFPENNRTSNTRNNFHDFRAGGNALFRYKLSPAMNVGLIANYNYGNDHSNGTNQTVYDEYSSKSHISTKSSPNNAITITGFYDWTFGAKGERLELTYNYFNRHSPTASKITTSYIGRPGSDSLSERGTAAYRFHSGNADFKLPYSWAQIEFGAAYTDILNSSALSTTYLNAVADRSDFTYSEKIAAAYVSASRSLGCGFWGKAALRYEYTCTKGELMEAGNPSHRNYGHIFPSANISWNKNGIGAFNISYSMGMSRPNLWELNPFKYYSTTDEYAAGNPQLKPTIYNNAEINYYGLGGLYAVMYTSFATDAIGYVRRREPSGAISTKPINCLSTNKTGLYASYTRNLTDWWEMNLGGEIFRSSSHSHLNDFKQPKLDDWSGKIEARANCMLNRQKTLMLNASFTHFFPYSQNMVEYKSFQLISLTLGYALCNRRLNLRLAANDLFGWNKTRSVEQYSGYTLRHTFNPHSAYVLFSANFTFGGEKVNQVWRNSKETQSSRTK